MLAEDDLLTVSISETATATQTGTETETETETDVRRNKDRIAQSLLAALVLCSVFFCVEMTAALVCGSLAILSDAFHLLTDIAAFAVSISALRMAQRTPSNDYTFGYARVEVLGACVSTLLIWAITVILVIEAYARLMTPTVIDAKVMFYTALFGVAVNIALAFTVAGGHDDDHHGHHHHHHVERVGSLSRDVEEGDCRGGSPTDSTSSAETHVDAQTPLLDSSHAHYSSCETPHTNPIPHTQPSCLWFLHTEHMDVNMRAAILHAVTDLISSLGVLLASIVLCVRPEWTWVDPLCTFFFSLCVFASTAGLMRRCVRVLMEGSPPHINVKDIKSELLDLPYVVRVQSLYLWCISQDTFAGTVVLKLERSADPVTWCAVIEGAKRVLGESGVTQVTVELGLEEAQRQMSC